jgi:hypothetical protein
VLIILPVIFLILPEDYFDRGRSICPSKVFLNIECLGCGMTRAFQHMIHLNFVEAWEFNKLSFGLLPILGFFYLKELLSQGRLIKEMLD